MNEYAELIYDNIENEKCIILLGPDIITQPENKSLHEAFIDSVFAEKKRKIFLDDDKLIVFDPNTSDKSFFPIDMKKFYNQNSKPNEFYSKIAQIPFHFIITTTPDLIMKKTFESLGIDHTFEYYNKTDNPKPVEVPVSKKTLVYNLFGSVNDEDSLILTNDDLLDFIFAILGDKKLPVNLQKAIGETKSFLFLGFDMEKWYMKIILRLFNLPKKAIPFAMEKSVKLPNTRNFYINNFKMEFIQEEHGGIIDKLFDEFKKNNKLREIKSKPESVFSKKIKNLIKNDEIEEAFEQLEEYFSDKDPELADKVTFHFGAYNRLQKNIKKGIVDDRDVNVQTAKIREALLDLCNEIQGSENQQ